MSNYIKPTFCKNYEDYSYYEETSCTLKHWPDMWPEEIAAEKAIAIERREREQRTFFLARDKVQRTIRHFMQMKESRDYMDKICARALASLADDFGWIVKNEDNMIVYKVSPIYQTSYKPEDE